MSELARTAKKPKAWAIVGISGIVGAFLILSFYSVIGGWSLYYTVNSVSGALAVKVPMASARYLMAC